jgi:hypothetical protein
VKVDVLAMASMKMAVFWVVALCYLMEVYRRFTNACCLLQVVMEAAGVCEALVTFYQTKGATT